MITIEQAIETWKKYYSDFQVTGNRHPEPYVEYKKVHDMLLNELRQQLPPIDALETLPIPEAGATGSFISKWSRGQASKGPWSDQPWVGWRESGIVRMVNGISLDVMDWK